MPARSAPPTLRDVAARAGVHEATVSRALNRPDMVAPTTRARVLDAVEALQFVPNHSAQQLAGGRAGTVGVVVPDIANPYFASILQAIQADATFRGRSVLIADSAGDPDTERRAITELSRRVDGLIVCTPVSDLREVRVPLVQINRRSRDVPSVVVDQTAIVTEAVGHLAALGHRRVAFLQGPSRYWSARQRLRAVRRLARDSRGGPEIEIVHPAPATFEGGRGVLGSVLATGATGVVAFNDIQAVGLVVGAHARGLGVPDDLSVVGSDGLQIATMTEPTLTTLVADRNEIGRRALARLVGDDRPDRQVLQPTLRPGGSTGAPPHTVDQSIATTRSRTDVG